MIPNGPIESYLKRLGQELRLPTWERARVLEEARDHLEEAGTSFQRAALDPSEAESRAVEAFGTVREVSARFQLESKPAGKIVMFSVLIKSAISALIFFTFALAVMMAGSIVFEPPDGRERVAVLLGVVVTIMVVNGFTLYHFWGPSGNRHRIAETVFAGSLLLIGFGVWEVIDVLRMGASSGDYEYFILGSGLALVAQASSSILYVCAGDTRPSVRS